MEMTNAGFLPVTKQDMEERGWEQADFVLVTGDAYVDHPSFGAAIIARVLENDGYKVAVLARPGWADPEDFRRFGRPRLGFLITGGCVDSMVNHYSVMKRRRRKDVYAPGGVAGGRPDRAVIVYANRAREAYKGIPVVIGGLEASLRRFGHYDYWDDRVRRSILLDARADILIYGMGEKSMLEVAAALNDGFDARDVTWVPGTAYRTAEPPADALCLPGFETLSDPAAYAESFKLQYENIESFSAKPLAEAYPNASYVVQNTPQPPLTQTEMDAVYELPYTGVGHPAYRSEGAPPAAEEIKFSLAANRGCFGGCAFCALTAHQGRMVTGRSRDSLLREAKKLTEREDFKGYIHDVGGPTANFRENACAGMAKRGACKEKDCLFPAPCPNLKADHGEFLGTLRALRGLPGVKKVFIRSGIRYDYLMADPAHRAVLREICEHHVSGMLKVAPEHIAPGVLKRMRKPGKTVYDAFAAEYAKANKRLSMNQYLLPYFISSHPGSTLRDAVDLALYLKQSGFAPDQVQDFYPVPGTLATCMYYAGMDPLTGEAVYAAKSAQEKEWQRALLHFAKPENRRRVMEALAAAGREDAMPVLFPPKIGRGPASGRGTKPGHETAPKRGTNPGRETAPTRGTKPGRRGGG
ncbi:MAG: YgiQ family radical SAM protein [Clostridiales Family XIII bacterium]|nr:YgiQ family radical SAM protein [Clostridiales Family XIII bacterium]